MTEPQRRMALAALLLSGSIFLSRILGYLRDAVIAFQLGASAETDAYYAAFLLPDMLNYFLAGGALSITFVPLFARMLSEGRPERAWQLYSRIVTLTSVVLLTAIIIAWFAAPLAVPVLFSGFDESQIDTTVRLTRIVLPGPLFFMAGGLLTATEMARKRFLAAALAPLLYNLCIVVGGLTLGNKLGAAGFSWGVLVGAILGPFLVPLVLSRDVAHFRPSFDIRDSELRGYFVRALPLMVGVSLLTVDEWFGRYFGSHLEEGAITWLNNARRLMMVPIALVGQAAATAALPFLAQLAAEKREQELARTLDKTVESAVTLATIAAIGCALLAHPIAVAIYQRGAFNAHDAAATGTLLRIQSFAIIGWSLQTIVLRAFYAREDTWRPMLITSLWVASMVPAYAWLSSEFRAEGLAMAASAGFFLGALVLIEAHRRIYRVSLFAAFGRGIARGVGASLAGAMLVGALLLSLSHWIVAPQNGTQGIVSLGVLGGAFGALALLGLTKVGGPAADAVAGRLGRVARKFKRGEDRNSVS